METWLVILLILIAVFLVIALVWMRWRMNVSKGRFALATLTSLLTIFLAFISANSAGITSKVLYLFINFVGLDASTIEINDTKLTLITGFVALVICFFIYRFAKTAIINWEAPPRVSEIELEQQRMQNNITMLAASQLKLMIKRQDDPIASEYARSWNRRFSEPPESVETRILLRDLFRAGIREANLPDDGWRDTGKFWVGVFFF